MKELPPQNSHCIDHLGFATSARARARAKGNKEVEVANGGRFVGTVMRGILNAKKGSAPGRYLQ